MIQIVNCKICSSEVQIENPKPSDEILCVDCLAWGAFSMSSAEGIDDLFDTSDPEPALVCFQGVPVFAVQVCDSDVEVTDRARLIW